MQNLPWIVALVATTLLALVLGTWGWRGGRRARPLALPSEWALTARPVFAATERRVHRLLREALPHHVVLSKLPLVRFCQPIDTGDALYWYDLLDNNQVSFAVCSPNGRVLAAIDLDSERGESLRRLQIKQSALSACRVRYLRCSIDQLPSLAELQSLVPGLAVTPPPRAPQPGRATPSRRRHQAVDDPARTDGSSRSTEPGAPLWHDSAALHDTFFAPESRFGSRVDNQYPSAGDSRQPAASLAHGCGGVGESREPDEDRPAQRLASEFDPRPAGLSRKEPGLRQ